MDWIKQAKDQAASYEQQRMQATEEALAREAALRDAESNWKERAIARARQVGREGMRLRISEKKGDILELSHDGKVQIELQGPGRFALKFFDVVAPTSLLLRQTLYVHRHRIVITAELNEHNIEEIMKYAALGQDAYHRMSEQARLEHNLDAVLETTNLEERIAS